MSTSGDRPKKTARRRGKAEPLNVPAVYTNLRGPKRTRTNRGPFDRTRRPAGNPERRRGMRQKPLAMEVATVLAERSADGAASRAGLSRRSGPGPRRLRRALASRLTAGDDPVRRLVEALKRRHLLLVLDNFEQVAAAAEAVAGLVSVCPHLALVVTSRRLLRLQGEHVLPLPPLPVPSDAESDPGRLAASPAVRCSASGRRPSIPASTPTTTRYRRWRRSAGASTACPSPSSWPPPTAGCLPRPPCWNAYQPTVAHPGRCSTGGRSTPDTPSQPVRHDRVEPRSARPCRPDVVPPPQRVPRGMVDRRRRVGLCRADRQRRLRHRRRVRAGVHTGRPPPGGAASGPGRAASVLDA